MKKDNLTFREKLKLVPNDFFIYPIVPILFAIGLVCIFVFGKIIDIYFLLFAISICMIPFSGYLYLIFDMMHNPKNNFRQNIE